MAARVDPALLAAINSRRRGDRHIAVTVVLQKDLHPGQPATTGGFRKFQCTVDDLVERVSDLATGEPDWVFTDPAKGAFELLARVSFVELLLLQPEVAECLNDLALYRLPRNGVTGHSSPPGDVDGVTRSICELE